MQYARSVSSAILPQLYRSSTLRLPAEPIECARVGCNGKSQLVFRIRSLGNR